MEYYCVICNKKIATDHDKRRKKTCSLACGIRYRRIYNLNQINPETYARYTMRSVKQSSIGNLHKEDKAEDIYLLKKAKPSKSLPLHPTIKPVKPYKPPTTYLYEDKKPSVQSRRVKPGTIDWEEIKRFYNE